MEGLTIQQPLAIVARQAQADESRATLAVHGELIMASALSFDLNLASGLLPCCRKPSCGELSMNLDHPDQLNVACKLSPTINERS